MYGIHDVTSGVPRKASWGEFSTAIYGNVAYVQTAAAFTYRGNPSCLHSDLEFQHRLLVVQTPGKLNLNLALRALQSV